MNRGSFYAALPGLSNGSRSRAPRLAARDVLLQPREFSGIEVGEDEHRAALVRLPYHRGQPQAIEPRPGRQLDHHHVAIDQGLIGPLARPFKAMLLSKFVSQEMSMVFAELNHNDLVILADMIQSGKMTPVIDRTYNSISDVPNALRYLEDGHARGKVVIKIE